MSYINLPTVLPGSPSKTWGQMQVILGPMFSGKSTELTRRVRCFQIAQNKCLVIKYAKDTRYSSSFSTHHGCTACLLQNVIQEAVSVPVIGIDKGQFSPEVVEFCEVMANAGKTVILAALDGTFQRKAFSSILNLVPLAESVVKLTPVYLECFGEAAYTKRLGLEKKVEVIGGADKYHSVCCLCFFKKSLVQPAGPAWRGLSCQEALCPSGSLCPSAQLCQLRGPGVCQLLPQVGLSESREGAGTAVSIGHCALERLIRLSQPFLVPLVAEMLQPRLASTCLVVKV